MAGSEAPHIGRLYAREIAGKGKLKKKSWNPVKKALGGPRQHEEFEPYDDDHPIVQVFRRPNAHYVAYDLWAYHMLFKGLTGEAHWWVMRNNFGVPVEIWVIPTHWMRLETGHYGEPVGYTVQSPWGQMQHIPYNEVVSFRDPSPLNMYEGSAILQASAEWIDSYESQVRARLAMFKNGGAPAFHILLGESYADPDEAFLARFYAKWMQRFQGENNWGKPVVTGPDVEVKTLGVTPDKIPFTEGEEMGRDEILAAFGVPKGVLGIEPTSDVSAYAPQRQFVRFRINPELKYIGEVITEKVIRQTPHHEDGVFFFDDHIINDPEQQRADINMRWEKGAISPNQVRVLYGDEPWEYGGDDPVLNGAPVPWGTGKKDQDGTDLDNALRTQLGRQQGDKYGLDQLDSGEWTVNDAEGHVLVGPFKTEELARVGMSKLQAKDAKEQEQHGGGQPPQIEYEEEDPAGAIDEDVPELGHDDDPPIDKDIDAPEKPYLKWHKTPHGDIEARGNRKWRIERRKDKRTGRVSYHLHLDGKPHDDSGAIGILKEVAEKIEKEHEAEKALDGSSGTNGGYLTPVEEVRLGANGAVAKALAMRIKQLESAAQGRPEQTFNIHLPESIAVKVPDVHIRNEIPVPQVTVKNDVGIPTVNVHNNVEAPVVQNHIPVPSVNVQNHVEAPTVNVQNNVEAADLRPVFQVPEQQTPKINFSVPESTSKVEKGVKYRAKRGADGTWLIEVDE